MIMATTYVIGKHATGFEKLVWWLVGLIVLVLILVVLFFLIRGIWRSGRNRGTKPPTRQSAHQSRG